MITKVKAAANTFTGGIILLVTLRNLLLSTGMNRIEAIVGRNRTMVYRKISDQTGVIFNWVRTKLRISRNTRPKNNVISSMMIPKFFDSRNFCQKDSFLATGNVFPWIA
jgi:hypothetical protein